MIKHTLFQGIATAMITPFSEDNTVDFEGLELLIQRQIEAGISALVVLGSTGEPIALSPKEKSSVFSFFIERAKGEIPLIFGCGNGNMEETVFWAKKSYEMGADGLLVSTPYYNKCTQKGLIHYYQRVASATPLPIVVYNVPSRTGVNILPATMGKISKIPTVVGLKDASHDFSQSLTFLNELKIPFYSGDDEYNFPFFCCGAQGSISVLSNLLPSRMVELFHTSKIDIQKAKTMHNELLPTLRSCFSEVNPIPIKRAMQLIGLPAGSPRPPLTPLSTANEQRLRKALNNFLWR